MPRYMLILTYDEAAALETPPDPSVFEEMAAYNTAMVDAGVMVSGEGLAPSEQGAIVTFDGGEPTTVDGPFTEAKEIIGGFWILEVGSRDEAVSWARRAPFRGGERLSVRRVTSAEDFADIAPEGVLENEERLRERVEQQRRS